MRLTLCAVALAICAGCRLGGDLDEVGEPCSSDLDCPEDMECVSPTRPTPRVCACRLRSDHAKRRGR
jgi:hypothetical protein